MKQHRKKNIVMLNILLVSILVMAESAFSADKVSHVKEANLERTRQQVKMLDDLYKSAVVLITKHYVKDSSILSAATASKALFAEMEKKGWHQVRLLGLTNLIYNPENKPNDTFEVDASKKLLAGAAWHEKVINKNGKPYLRVATAIPVVMEKCIMCHATWKGNKGNIGALSYTVPILE